MMMIITHKTMISQHDLAEESPTVFLSREKDAVDQSIVRVHVTAPFDEGNQVTFKNNEVHININNY